MLKSPGTQNRSLMPISVNLEATWLPKVLADFFSPLPIVANGLYGNVNCQGGCLGAVGPSELESNSYLGSRISLLTCIAVHAGRQETGAVAI